MINRLDLKSKKPFNQFVDGDDRYFDRQQAVLTRLEALKK